MRDRPSWQNRPFLANTEGQRNRLGGDVFGGVLERVDVESLADVIVGEVFDCRIRNQFVIPCLPSLMRREEPSRFLMIDTHSPGDAIVLTKSSELFSTDGSHGRT